MKLEKCLGSEFSTWLQKKSAEDRVISVKTYDGDVAVCVWLDNKRCLTMKYNKPQERTSEIKSVPDKIIA